MGSCQADLGDQLAEAACRVGADLCQKERRPGRPPFPLRVSFFIVFHVTNLARQERFMI